MTAVSDLAARRALEAAGVEFIDENGGGPGVRLRKPPKIMEVTKEICRWLDKNKPCTNCAIGLMAMEVSRDPKLKVSHCSNRQLAQSNYEQVVFA